MHTDRTQHIKYSTQEVDIVGWNSSFGPFNEIESGEFSEQKLFSMLSATFLFWQKTDKESRVPAVKWHYQQQQPWSYQESTKQEGYSSGNNMMQGENNNTSMQIYSPEFASVQMNTTMMNNNGVQSDFNNYQAVPLQQVQTLSKKSDDGYNWRKYGQKTSERKWESEKLLQMHVPELSNEEKVERSVEGQITEIVYKGTHNHPKPQSTRKNSSNALVIVPANPNGNEIINQSYGSFGNGHNNQHSRSNPVLST